MKYYDKLVFELSKPGRTAYTLPNNGFKASLSEIPAGLLRSESPVLPEVSEPDLVRHYTNLSQMNFGVDTGFYPLGSCTMKYNPKINEEIAAMPAFIPFRMSLQSRARSRFTMRCRRHSPPLPE